MQGECLSFYVVSWPSEDENTGILIVADQLTILQAFAHREISVLLQFHQLIYTDRARYNWFYGGFGGRDDVVTFLEMCSTASFQDT
jgi:hypothetical protein